MTVVALMGPDRRTPTPLTRHQVHLTHRLASPSLFGDERLQGKLAYVFEPLNTHVPEELRVETVRDLRHGRSRRRDDRTSFTGATSNGGADGDQDDRPEQTDTDSHVLLL
ncbi:MAG: hypothetical protein A2669_01445 [Candidatus Yanofskybacteria bacterium RIFCSPHIGHO2_01_FULL_48_25b]|uniref:Uncharacterized protein n=1 Tax=Candidatus Yanofskybacteria bacterium RIFCSPHIGHO2_01_FULL_48_25b TaxID=1802672 RepID=A0A1F8EZV7_9BACT|nr:MAG: hypothetical protein A2669_01445 [Candidatus Yanofskybacteria bacterium RIFCSPHIGHO2_01_FULL_48_25b]